jgi:hypothetical protein
MLIAAGAADHQADGPFLQRRRTRARAFHAQVDRLPEKVTRAFRPQGEGKPRRGPVRRQDREENQDRDGNGSDSARGRRGGPERWPQEGRPY